MITVRRRTMPAHRTAGATRLAGWPRGALLALVLGAFAAACQDATSPMDGPKPQFAQGADGIWTVNSTDDPGLGDACDDNECTLREAIYYAQFGDRITFAPEVTGTILLKTGTELVISKPLSLVGPGAHDLAIDAQGNSRVFRIDDVDPGTQLPVEISGLTVVGGIAIDDGGGVFNAEILTLSEVVVTGNSADGAGGGIHSVGNLTVRNSTVSSNTAGDHAGGIYAGTGLTVIGSTVTANTAGTHGGGIFAGAGAYILGTTSSGNSAPEGAGVYLSGVDKLLSVRSSTITDEIHAYGDGASVTFHNTVVGGACEVEFSALMTSLGYNVLADCAAAAPDPTDIVLTDGELFTEVIEQELKDNGGPTRTHALIAGGDAVDAGYCPAQTEDQRGFTRPVDNPFMPNAMDGCDIGAYELQGPFVPVADLMVSQAVDKTSVKQGQLLTYSIRVQNLGPETAPNVVMNDVLSSGVTFVEARLSKGTHTAPPKGETGTVTWYLGDLLDQGNEVAELVVTVLVKGKTTITNTATVTGVVADPNEANNTASLTVSVGSGGGGGRKK